MYPCLWIEEQARKSNHTLCSNIIEMVLYFKSCWSNIFISALEVFRGHLSEFSRQEDELKRAVDAQALGLLLIKLNRLKEEVLPSNRSLRMIIEEVMPR